MMYQNAFPMVLRIALAVYGITPYRLALNSRVSASTICKIMNPEKYDRGATEAQVLRIFVGLVCDEKRRWEMLDLIEAKDTLFFETLEELLEPKKLTRGEVAIVANIGEERLEEGRSGRCPLSDALKLRLLIGVRCTIPEIKVGNVLLQAAGFYIMRCGPEEGERAA